MKWKIDKRIKDEESIIATSWIMTEVMGEDLDKIEYINISLGRGKLGGIYGRCHYPTRQRKSYRISCQVPGPYPMEFAIKNAPIYYKEDERNAIIKLFRDSKEHVIGGKCWLETTDNLTLNTMAEGIVFIVMHELFHYFRKTGQITGRNVEWQADAYAKIMLKRYQDSLGRMNLGPSVACPR
jgi:hypothetical protein